VNPSGLVERYLGHQAGRRAASRQQVIGFLLLLTVAALVAVFGGLLPARSVARAYLLAGVALGAAAVVAGTLSRFDRIERTRPPRRSAPPAPTPLPPFVERVERRRELASEFAGEFELLKPRLRQIAEQRLAGRGLRLESARARQLLGEQPWLLLERPLQRDKFAPGPDPTELDGLLHALERI
jgi:hypothetical protein